MGQPDESSRQTRRAVLATCGALVTAGCLDDLTSSESDATDDLGAGSEPTATPADEDDSGTPMPEDHPFADRTAVVTIERVEADHERLERLLREAIDFWNQHSDEYLQYSTTLVYRPEAEDPDIVVEERSAIEECGLHDDGEFAGCATLLQPGDDDILPADVDLVPAPSDWLYRRVIKHELGHVLGLTHDDEPVEIMHESVEHRYPEHDDRMEILELRDEWVQAFNAAIEALTDGFDAADDDDFETAGTAFATANSHYDVAADRIETATGIAAELSRFEPADREALLDMLDHERSFAASMQSALDLLEAGSEEIADGEDGYETYNEGVDAYNETIEISLPRPDEYVDALGLSPIVEADQRR